jgi:hypothetical protein
VGGRKHEGAEGEASRQAEGKERKLDRQTKLRQDGDKETFLKPKSLLSLQVTCDTPERHSAYLSSRL